MAILMNSIKNTQDIENMTDLKEYINLPQWDAHVHLIGNDPKYRIAKKCIEYVNWLPYDRKRSLYKMIKDIPQNQWNVIALNGSDPKEMRQAAKDENFPLIGEININKTYKDENRETKKLEDFEIYDVIKNDPRPIVVHFDLETEQDCEKLEEMAKRRKTKKILLSHMGGNYFLQNKEQIFKWMPILMERNPNLWTDISWSTLSWVEEHPDILKEIDTGRVLIGSDLCRDSDKMTEERKRQLKKFENMILTSENMKMFIKNM